MKLLAPLTLVAMLLAQQVLAAEARLSLPELAGLEDKASESVNIALDGPLIKLASGFLDPHKPEEAAAKDIISGLTGIYVKSFSFENDFAYPMQDVERVRKQLTGPGWQRMVQVRSKKEQSNVDVYIAVDGGLTKGLAIIASEPRQFTIVNIVGAVDMEKLHQLEGRFGVPKLELETKKPDPAGGAK
jgi:uncharacterized protein DUF4252